MTQTIPSLNQRLGIEIEDGVAVVTINAPHNLNALDHSLKLDIATTIREYGSKPELNGIVITGAGRAFSAGQDLKETSTGHDLSETMEAFADLTRAVLESSVPVIGAINGCVVGGAAEWTLCFDARLASPEAYYYFPERLVGFAFSNASSLLFYRVMRGGDVPRVALSGERVYAEEARELGLVGQVVPAPELIGAAVAQAMAWKGPNGEPATQLLRLLRPRPEEIEEAFARENAASQALQRLGAGAVPAPGARP